PWDKVASALKTAAGFAGNLIKAFTNLPPEVQGTIIALAGLNKLSGGAVSGLVSELGKGLIKGVLGITAAQVNIKAATVIGAGGGIPGAPPGTTPATAAGKVASIVQKVFIVGAAAGVIAEAFNASGLFDPTHRDSAGNVARTTNDPNQRIADILASIKQLQPRAAGGDTVAQRQLTQLLAELAKLQGTAAETQRQAAATAGEGAKLQNVTNERLEAIRGFTETSATAADEAKKAQVAAIQQASADQVHTTERHEQNIADKIKELNAQARTAAQLAAGDSRSEQAAFARAANQTAAATVTAGGKAAAAGNVVATAVRNKDLSVTLKNYLTVNTSVSVANDLNAKNNYKSVYRVAT